MIGIANLRGLKDTAVPMWIAAFGYWLVGFPISWLLGFHTALGGTGIWLGLAFALATVGVIMVLRFERLTAAAIARSAPGLSDRSARASVSLKKSTVRCQASLAAASL